MEDAIINILIVNESKQDFHTLKRYLHKPGHNILCASTPEQAFAVLAKIEIGILLISHDHHEVNWEQFIAHDYAKNTYSECFILATGEALSDEEVAQLFALGISDFIEKPYNKTRITAKINNFKRLYFKNKTIVNLLENILPQRVLTEFKQHNKYSPKKHQNCAILFTDFVGFSKKALSYQPSELLKILDYYFTAFDYIFEKYDIEKIKTIGDSYMAVSGLHEMNDGYHLKMTLAALEIQQFIKEDIANRKTNKKDFWEIRIGIHSGDLIAGVIGRKKFTFDVWGDSVNVAARCEQHAPANQINISEALKLKIEPYFNFTNRGSIQIKHGTKMNMFVVQGIKSDYCETDNCVPNQALRAIAKLPELDFEGIKEYVLDTLNSQLNPKLVYHSYRHTINVEKAVVKYAKLEGVNEHFTTLLRTAALFHDSGYIHQYQKNEKIAVNHLTTIARKFGYNYADIQFMNDAIMATSKSIKPKNLFEEIICDADHDYLGRKDYHVTAEYLRQELADYGDLMSDQEWLERQINYLEKEHQYYTTSAINIRQVGKDKRIVELKEKLALLHLKK